MTRCQEHYYSLKDNRLCVRCKADMDRDGAYCSKCSRNNTSRESRDAWRKKKILAGCCGNCGKRNPIVCARPEDQPWYCPTCESRRREVSARAYRDAHPTVKKVAHCSVCGEAGHNSRRHRAVLLDEMRPPAAVDFATARLEWNA